MKNPFHIALVLFAFLSSCTKETNDIIPEEIDGPRLIVFRDYDNDHQVSIQRWTTNNTPGSLNILGQFNNDGSSISDAELIINGNEVWYSEQTEFSENHTDTDDGFEELIAAHDGQLVDVAVDVMGTSESISIYSPEGLIVETSQNIDSLDRTEDLTITWNSDPANPYGDISVALISRGIDGNPDEETANLHHTVVIDDSGSYTIPSSEFENWPVGLHIDLALTRANERLMPETKTLISAYVQSLQIGEVVE
jgi:hypothetical protein